MIESTLRVYASHCSVGVRARARSLDAWRRAASFTAVRLTPRGGIRGMFGAWEMCDQRHGRCHARGAPAQQLQLLVWPSLAPVCVHAAEYNA
eukprot:6323357-Lingulodinium_polyedra.AAC.1